MNFQIEALSFLDRLFLKLKESNFQIKPHWDIDHLCYRANSNESYGALKEEFLNFSDLLIESHVNGRLISTFKLKKPIRYQNWNIQLVELPAPKTGKTTIEGFEHIEVVIDQTFEEIEKQYSEFSHDKSGLKKKLNQEFEFCFGEINVKFHHLSLESVINLEKNIRVIQALEKSKVLEILKDNQPLIAGTFPLGIDIEESDLDLILYSRDLNSLATTIKMNWGGESHFKMERVSVDGEDSLIASFIIQSVPFELFAQNIPSVHQKAYKNFLVEEKILKSKNDDFKKEIRELKKSGTKTEPAFAKLLNLAGDPYQAMLELQKNII